ncbi:MAG: transposase [Gammaproteobacteria bacterium]|nr:transposase [Gammaproteobacteria bacterium]
MYCTGTLSPANPDQPTSAPSIVLYDYHASRANGCMIEFLQGYLQVDGYQGYTSTKAMLVGCWPMRAENSLKRISLKKKVNLVKLSLPLTLLKNSIALKLKLWAQKKNTIIVKNMRSHY